MVLCEFWWGFWRMEINSVEEGKELSTSDDPIQVILALIGSKAPLLVVLANSIWFWILSGKNP